MVLCDFQCKEGEEDEEKEVWGREKARAGSQDRYSRNRTEQLMFSRGKKYRFLQKV